MVDSTDEFDLARDYLRHILLAPVYDVAVKTPLDRLVGLSDRFGCDIWLKREDIQPVHSFKLRGAYNRICQLNKAQASSGVIAASAGNHAQGVALSAQANNIRAVIVMPVTTPEIKVNAVASLGGEVILHGDNFDAAYQHAHQIAVEQQLTLIPPFDDPAVIAGQGTVGLELLQQNRALDAVFVPVGGGGLVAGVAAYIKALKPGIKVIGVEPEDAACLKAALAAGEPVTLDRVGLFADGVAVKRIGDEPFKIACRYVDEVVTVNSDEICAAVKDIFEDTRAIAEPSGALALAGLKRYRAEGGEGQQLAAVLSGANVNFHSLRYVSERCELGEGKEAVLAVTIPEEKGSFRRFCEVLGKRLITEFNYRLAERDSANIFVGIKVADTAEQAAISELLQTHGYAHQDLSTDETAKLHVRYMVGGRPSDELSERLFHVTFPESPGALLEFLSRLGERWNISLFHYRNHGADYGRVLLGLEAAPDDNDGLTAFIQDLPLRCREITDSKAYQFFLKPSSK